MKFRSNCLTIFAFLSDIISVKKDRTGFDYISLNEQTLCNLKLFKKMNHRGKQKYTNSY